MSNQESSIYTQYLPRIYQKGSNETYDDYFLGRFLKAFEKILTGTTETGGGTAIGIETLLDRFSQYFDPAYTPAQLLNWLAGWVGLELEENTEFFGDDDISEKSATPIQILPLNASRCSINRSMIETVVQLYKKTGTAEGLLKYLQIYAGEETTISIDEYEETAAIGNGRTVGKNTMVGYAKPDFFSVHALIPAHNRSILENRVGLIRKVIENEKPFYTSYALTVEVPTMIVGVYSRVGKETLLGGMVED